MPFSPSPYKIPLHTRISKLRFKGIYDWQKLYRAMLQWGKDREYEFSERQYKHKWKGKKAELEIRWTFQREINEFAQNEIRVYFHVWDHKEVEVVKNGEKKKMVSGRFFVDIDGDLNLDWQKRWNDAWWKRAWRDFYIKFVIRHEIEDIWWDKLWYNANKLQQLTKRELGIESESDVYDDMW